MQSLVTVAIALMAGLLATRVFKVLHLKFPDVTAFLLAGLAVGPYGIGRLGIPHRQKAINIICVVMDAPMDAINALSGALGRLRGISAKVTYSKK